MKLLFLLLFFLIPLPAQSSVRCHVDVPYYGVFNTTRDDAFDAVIYYNNSTCPFNLPKYDLTIGFSHVSFWQAIYFNLWEADYSITMGQDNVTSFSFNQVRSSAINPACTIHAVSTDGKMVFLLSNYWISGNAAVEIGHPSNVSVCGGVF